jgi:acyl-CoA reductase-like NAD-dependent aldehyde dehydrogenase
MNQLKVDGNLHAPDVESMAAKPLLDAERLSGKVVVGGVLCSPITSERFAVENPANQSEIVFVPRCREADVERAVNSAHEAFQTWRKVSARQRGDMLRQIADAIEQQGENLARLLSLETGNALVTQARPEITAMVEMLRLFAGLGSELKGKTLPWEFGHLCYTTREPLGVIAAIIPWNAPLFLTAVKLGPALIAGNTVVMKTAEQAPLAVMRSIEIMQAFLPPGVVNVISGFGPEAGKPLAEHPLVKKITFTGSGAVGRAILHYAADKLCPVTLELGGKSPNIILPDADLDLAVPGILTGMRFTRQGQSCSAGSRLLVHDAIYDEVVERAIDAMAKLHIGNPLDELTQVGALVSGEQFDRVSSYVKLARETPGAKILCGGARPEGVGLDKGYFYQPTLIEGLPHESPVCQDEIFGPVAVLSRWTDYEEMIRIANRTEFGLAAAVWTRDISRAMDLVNRVEAGFVQVNQFITPRASLAYGGFKNSGLGKENTLESMLDHFTTSKTVIINPGTPCP